jgi:uncharacterized protein involved in exopolysaccharide biosynthesis
MLISPTTPLIRDPDQILSETLELSSFVRYALSRWKFIAKACAATALLVGCVSFFLPKKYTATASIVVQPPEGMDSRASLAVSSIYLESLKTYEHYASSDSLFESALTQMNLRSAYAGVPIEVLKGRILEITKPRDTKILEIRATLRDPKKAQQFAFYIAQQTTEMNRRMQAAVVHELTDATGAVVGTARQRVERARQARDAFLQRQPIASLENDLRSAAELKNRVDDNLVDARVELAAYKARTLPQSKDSEGADSLRAVEAQVRTLESESRALQHRITSNVALLEQRKHDEDNLEKELQTAQTQLELENGKINEVLTSAPARGERLEIVDPGVVPEKPSSPNIPLNMAIGLIASICLALLYLAIAFNIARSPEWNERFPRR